MRDPILEDEDQGVMNCALEYAKSKIKVVMDDATKEIKEQLKNGTLSKEDYKKRRKSIYRDKVRFLVAEGIEKCGDNAKNLEWMKQRTIK